MTEQLFYRDAMASEFEARILSVTQEKNGWRVVLDQTLFYPEGGGQPADRGWLNNVAVLDVQKEKSGDEIVHFLESDPGSGMARGRIDMDRRHDFMQQHTGQHIISGALWQVGGYITLSVHMGQEYTAIEIAAPEIPGEHIIMVEDLSNRIICRDLPLEFITVPQDELHLYPVRKKIDREGPVRLVRIGDFDCVACGGLHWDSTRHVQIVKAIGLEKIRGNCRIAWKIGKRAYADYTVKDKLCVELKQILGAGEENLTQKVRDMRDELTALTRRGNELESRLAEQMAAMLREKRDENFITAEFQAEDPNVIKKIMKTLIQLDNTAICLINIFPDQLLWSIGCGESVVFPFQQVQKELLPVINGKGGGRAPLWQGSGVNNDGVADFLALFRRLEIFPAGPVGGVES